MKVRKLAILMFPLGAMLTMGLVACEEKPEGDAEVKKDEAPAADAAKAAEMAKPEPAKPAEPPPPKEPPAPPPAEVCNALVGAIKAKDETKVMTLSTSSAAGAMGAEGAKDHIMASLEKGACGAAKVEGDLATVAVTGGAMPMDVPFVKEGPMWKFDAASFLTKYPPKHKDAKAAHGGKHPPHGKGKHKH